MLPHYDADQVAAAVSPADAVALLRDALRAGLDPAADPPRTGTDMGSGQLLTMPARAGDRAGVKLVFVAPGNTARGLATVQGVYLLCDAETFVPLATMDGAALTTLRTPATSVAAVEAVLARGRGPVRVVVVGAGVQARGHVDCLDAVLAGWRPVERVDVLVRDPARAAAVAGWLPGERCTAVALGSAAASGALAAADVVVCATTAGEPLFDSSVLRDDVVVAAVGSHEPHRRELDAALMARATVVVEDRATALREAGDVVMAVAEGALAEDELVDLAALLSPGEAVPAGPVVFKGTGMAWQDLVVAAAVHARLTGRAAEAVVR